MTYVPINFIGYILDFFYGINLTRALTENITQETPEAEVGWFHPDELPDDMASPRITELILSVRDRIIDIKDEFFDA